MRQVGRGIFIDSPAAHMCSLSHCAIHQCAAPVSVQPGSAARVKLEASYTSPSLPQQPSQITVAQPEAPNATAALCRAPGTTVTDQKFPPPGASSSAASAPGAGTSAQAGVAADACKVCGKAPGPPDFTLARCSKCKAVPYCGVACQKADWPAHKKVCAQLKQQQEQKAMQEERERERLKREAERQEQQQQASQGLQPSVKGPGRQQSDVQGVVEQQQGALQGGAAAWAQRSPVKPAREGAGPSAGPLSSGSAPPAPPPAQSAAAPSLPASPAPSGKSK